MDEFAHLPAGARYWMAGDFELYAKNPPLIKLWMAIPLFARSDLKVPDRLGPALGWGPWTYGSQFEAANRPRYLDLFFSARVMIILLGLASGLLIYLWALKFSAPAALLAAAGFLLSPTVLAHGHLATVDVGAVFFMLLFCFCLQLWKRPLSNGFPILIGALFGFALAAKFTAIFLLPFLIFFLAFQKQRRLAAFALTFLSLLLTLGASYGFSGLFQTPPVYTAQATQFFLGWWPESIPLPIPHDFLVGFDAQTVDAERGEFGSFLMGEWSQQGWWYYNYVALGLKEPVMTLALWVVALIFAFYGLIRKPSHETVFIVAPLLLLLIPLSFASRLQIGVRYLLPVFPFLFLLIAKVWAEQVKNPRWLLLPLATWIFTAVISTPNSLLYFNEIARVLGPSRTLLLDSNLDWGQDLYRLRGINEESGGPIGLMYFGHVDPKIYEIDYQLIPAQKTRGLLAVSANFLMGYPYIVSHPNGTLVEVGAQSLAWLRSYTPVREEGSILIFDTREEVGIIKK